MATPSSDPAAPSFLRWARRAKLLIRLLIVTAVVLGIAYTADKALESLEQEDFALADLARLDGGWLSASAAFYVASLAPACGFWFLTLRSMGQRPAPWRLVRAYLIGHLGKYVPGKAMVVVVRTGMIRGPGVDTATAAASVFVETLTLMAVGACLASALLAALYREQTGLVVLGVFMALASGVPLLPPIFRRIVRTLQIQRLSSQIDRAMDGLNGRLALWGVGLMALSWGFMGLSLWAVLESIPGVAVERGQGPLLLVTVALALVTGFVSFIPGGLGARELVVIPLLAPAYGQVVAVVSAILLRLVWLLSELAVSGIVYLIPARGSSASNPPCPSSPAGASHHALDCDPRME